MTPLRAAPLLALSALLIPTAARPAAVDASPPTETFGEAISVDVVNVEVRVTDARGRPVTGLAREDFRLFEDGEPVEIEHFSVERAEPSAPPDEPAADRGEPASGDERVPPSADREPLRMVLFVDQAHLHPSNRARLAEDLQRFVADTLRPDDEVMVVDHDRGLRLRQTFTGDRDALQEALRAVTEAGTSNLHALSARRDALRELSEGISSCDEVELLDALAHARRYASFLQAEAESSLDALGAVVGTLRGLPGRTILVYVGDGLEQQPAADLFDALTTSCPLGSLRPALAGEGSNWNLTPALRELTAYANAHRVTLYPYDAAGLRADVDSELGGSPSLRGQRMRIAGLQGSLFYLADQTGGKALLHANRLAPELAEVVEDASTFYSLAFRPEHHGDGRVHRIRVEVRGDPHRVRYRKQYLDVPEGERVFERMVSVLLHGAVDNPLGVRLAFGEPTAAAGESTGEEKTVRLPVQVRVPLESVALTPDGDVRSGRVVLYLATLDAEGRWSEVRQKEIPVRAGPDDAVESFVVTVDLPPGEAKVAIGLRDALGGATSYLRAELRLGNGPAPDGAEAGT